MEGEILDLLATINDIIIQGKLNLTKKYTAMIQCNGRLTFHYFLLVRTSLGFSCAKEVLSGWFHVFFLYSFMTEYGPWRLSNK